MRLLKPVYRDMSPFRGAPICTPFHSSRSIHFWRMCIISSTTTGCKARSRLSWLVYLWAQVLLQVSWSLDGVLARKHG
ncbi:hypothetical protein BDR06DRAFT_740671 [Suillus hirtellus]|nr:hypothetical protein BDR06DRAFT_740671 [Suillus hirtellus]